MLQEPLKIDQAQGCYHCKHLGTDDAGGDFSTKSWFVCHKGKLGQNLKSFPFQKPQPCYEPSRHSNPCEALLEVWRRPIVVEPHLLEHISEEQAIKEEKHNRLIFGTYAVQPNPWNFSLPCSKRR